MPNDARPPSDYWDHMKGKGMSDELAGWIFYHKMHGDKAKASAAVKEMDPMGFSKFVTEAMAQYYTEHFNKSKRETIQMERGCLTKCNSIQEAIKILDDAKIPQDSLVRFTVNTAFRMTEPKDRQDSLAAAEKGLAGEPITKGETQETAAHGTEGSSIATSTTDVSVDVPWDDSTDIEGATDYANRFGGEQTTGGAPTKKKNMTKETEDFNMGQCVANKIAGGMDAEKARAACSGEHEAFKKKQMKETIRDVGQLKETVLQIRNALVSIDKRFQETLKTLKPVSLADVRGPPGSQALSSIKETTPGNVNEINKQSLEEIRKDVLVFNDQINDGLI